MKIEWLHYSIATSIVLFGSYFIYSKTHQYPIPQDWSGYFSCLPAICLLVFCFMIGFQKFLEVKQ